MATPTYDLIDSVTLSSDAAEIEFTGLDTLASGYRDLVLRWEGKPSTGAVGFVIVRVNNDSSGNYGFVYADGSGSGTSSSSSLSGAGAQFGILVDDNAENLASARIHFLDFSQTDKHKAMLGLGGDPFERVGMGASRWANTSAITSIKVSVFGGDTQAGTNAYLYGIAG